MIIFESRHFLRCDLVVSLLRSNGVCNVSQKTSTTFSIVLWRRIIQF